MSHCAEGHSGSCATGNHNHSEPSLSLEESTQHNTQKIYEVLVVGAGPQSLAFMSRLGSVLSGCHGNCDLFTDAEHSRRCKETEGCEAPVAPFALEDVIVLDKFGSWMKQWRSVFSTLQLEYLRSTVTAHPSPRHPHDLLSHFHLHGKKDDLKTPHDSVFHSKHTKSSTQENPLEYYTPSTAMFNEFCESLISNYALEDRVVKASVSDITVHPAYSTIPHQSTIALTAVPFLL